MIIFPHQTMSLPPLMKSLCSPLFGMGCELYAIPPRA
nr:MAG TPA: hypothetical protein [Caudoviricetes sp.]